ncbi:MAG: LysM peptidoglycan-binding domain-containing protein [Chloroflexota bacterium]|nr:LysM peptidoglycan-binding domain-containing protein [Chloroflexota bacterium]
MQRPRFLVLTGTIVTALAVGPSLGAVALAADPTVVVQPGDTLTAISRRHNVPVNDLVALNGLGNPNRIYAGQTLRVGVETPVPVPPPATPAPAATTAPSAGGVHAVQRGENLTWIARRFGVTVAAIVAANGIGDPGRIYAGQQLIIPGTAPAAAPSSVPAAAPVAAPAAPAAAAPVGPQVHAVQRGENLTWIARRFGVTVAAIVAANGIGDPGRIYAGQQLIIPGTVPAAAPPPAAPAPPTLPPSMAALVAGRADVRQMIVEEAAQFGVPAPFALAVAWQESGWQQGVVSHAGAIGVMQLMPATVDWVAQAMLGTPVNAHDTRQNVRAGVRLLAHYLARYGGNRELVLAAYYQGQSAVDRHGIYAVSRPYIASVLVLERLFGG